MNNMSEHIEEQSPSPVKKHAKRAGTAVAYTAAATWAWWQPALAAAHPPPQEFCDGLDTSLAWLTGISGTLAVIGLILVGTGMFFAHRNEMGGGPLTKLGWWVAGVCLVAGASGLAKAFLPQQLNCG